MSNVNPSVKPAVAAAPRPLASRAKAASGAGARAAGHSARALLPLTRLPNIWRRVGAVPGEQLPGQSAVSRRRAWPGSSTQQPATARWMENASF
jgi:hypothetical protein